MTKARSTVWRHQNFSLRNSQVICKVALAGTYVLIGAITALLLAMFFGNQNDAALGRVAVCAAALAYIGVAQWLWSREKFLATAYLVVFFYTALASVIVWTWGINTPIAPLLFGLVIVLAGILLSARHAIAAAIICGSILFLIQAAVFLGWHNPDTSWLVSGSSYSDVLGYWVVFSILALISWLYNREMERSLQKAQHAQAALLQQKATLKEQVKERTAELRQAQLEEMRHMYRFAELGQLGATLLHDLANQVTALTLEIEGLKSTQQTKDIARAREIIHYLEKIVGSTRDRLQGGTQVKPFNIIQQTNETVAFLRYKAAKVDVAIEWHPPAIQWQYTGDPTSLAQILTIVISNAIDAYKEQSPSKGAHGRRVLVTMERDDTQLVIKIADWGPGIPKHARQTLFKPFRSGKKSGLGIGLFIARQTVENHFGGSLTLSPGKDPTEFIIKLPFKLEIDKDNP